MIRLKNEKAGDILKTLRSQPGRLIWAVGLATLVIGSLIPKAGLTTVDTRFGVDKVIRILAFAFLSFYPVAYFRSIKIGLSIASCLAPLGFLLEYVQKHIPGRTFSPQDMIANNIGTILGILLAVAIRAFFYTGRAKRRHDKKGKQESDE